MDQGIVFVDDEENILNSLGRELRVWLKARNLTFWPLTSADDTLAFLETHHRKVLVLVSDMRMPGMSGDTLVSRVRAQWPEIQTLVLSGHAEMHGLARAVAAGIRGFIPKPWEPETLTAELDKALKEREKLRRASIERQHLAYQLTRTKVVQTSMFRRDSLDPDRFGLELTYQPLVEHICGGDFYEVFHLSPDRCAVLVGDVSGHGAEAAFITGVLHTLINRDDVSWFLTGGASPGLFLQKLNSLVFSHLSADQARNVALTVLLFDRTDESLTLANAGGLPLVRIREGGGTAFHQVGIPLGLAPEAEYPVRTLKLKPADRWVVMTDGLVDRGHDGFLAGGDLVRIAVEAFVSGRGHQGILEDVVGLFPGGVFLDDLTLVSLEIR